MSTLARHPLTTHRSSTTAPVNEWGVYDPAVAGIEALFARVDPDGIRREREPAPRRRSRRKAERDDTGGVGLAINEAIARARLKSPAGLSPAEVQEELALLDARLPTLESPNAARRQPRSRPAIWLRAAVEPAGTPNDPDPVHGIFATLSIPATVALVQYARGCRIGPIHIPAE